MPPLPSERAIFASYKLWRRHADPDGLVSASEFAEMDEDDKREALRELGGTVPAAPGAAASDEDDDDEETEESDEDDSGPVGDGDEEHDDDEPRASRAKSKAVVRPAEPEAEDDEEEDVADDDVSLASSEPAQLVRLSATATAAAVAGQRRTGLANTVRVGSIARR